MEKTRYAFWFLGTVALVLLAVAGFNWAAGAFILHHPAGASVQTLSGFERALKPVWLSQIEPEIVFVGSSRVRDGFDPVLVDPALHTHSFNYGASSMTPYEARRFTQDALAQPSVKRVVVALEDALKRFPTGVYALWYPLLQRSEPRQMISQLKQLPVKSWLHVTLSVHQPREDGFGMHGSGLFILNPPWMLHDELKANLPYLRDVLGLDQGASYVLEQQAG